MKIETAGPIAFMVVGILAGAGGAIQKRRQETKNQVFKGNGKHSRTANCKI